MVRNRQEIVKVGLLFYYLHLASHLFEEWFGNESLPSLISLFLYVTDDLGVRFLLDTSFTRCLILTYLSQFLSFYARVFFLLNYNLPSVCSFHQGAYFSFCFDWFYFF